MFVLYNIDIDIDTFIFYRLLKIIHPFYILFFIPYFLV